PLPSHFSAHHPGLHPFPTRRSSDLTPAVNLALACVRKGGKVVLVGNVAPKVEFPLQMAVTRELTIFGSCASRGEYPACLDLLEGDRKSRRLISSHQMISYA